MNHACLANVNHSLTVKEAIELFTEHLETLGRSPETIDTYKDNLYRFYRYLCNYYNSQIYVDKITDDDLLRYLREEYNHEYYASAYRFNIVTAFKCFLRFCYRKGYCTEDIAKKIKQVKRKVKERVYLTDKEVEKLLLCIEHPVIKAVVQTMYYAGLRISECIQLKVSDVDFEKNWIMIQEDTEGNIQKVPISHKLRSALLSYVENRGNSQEFDFFFATRTGKLSAGYVNLKLKEASEKAGLKKVVTNHILRHSFASNLLEKGADIFTVQKLLRHKNLKTTLIYLHADIERLRKAIELIS